MLLPNQSRFKAGALVGCWLAGQACSSALGQDFEKQTTAALDQDKTLYLHSTSVPPTGTCLLKRSGRTSTGGPWDRAAAQGRNRRSARRHSDADLEARAADRSARGLDGPLSAGTWSAGVASAAFAVEGVRLYGALGSERCALAGDVDREPRMASDPAVRQLQPPGRLVPNERAGHQRGLEGAERPKVDRADRRQHRPLCALREMPVSMQAGYYYNIERPDGGSDWELRFQLRLLFPG